MGCYKKLNKGSDRNILVVWMLAIVIVLCACDSNKDLTNEEIIHVAVLPDQNEVHLRARYQPLLDYLKSHANLNAKLLIPADYTQLLDWFDDKKIDLAMFGGVTYVKAHIRSNASALVMRDVDGRFRSVGLVRVENPADNFKQLKGESLAFGSRLSTSGHLMPRHYFSLEQIIPETYFSEIKYSDAHDRTAEWVRDGKVDFGVANSGVVNEMFLDGRLSKDKVKVIWESPPFSDYVWAVQSDISKPLRTLIRDAFLHMNQDQAEYALLQRLGANYYIPAKHQDFSVLEDVVIVMGQDNF